MDDEIANDDAGARAGADGGEGPLVTIGIPTFNRADAMLGAALERALAQTHERLEIVVADNCSDDRTPELVAGYDDPRIRYVRHAENIGANANFNFCAEAARGEYFLLFHDDDLIDVDFVETCLDAADAHHARTGVRPSTVRTGTRVIDGDDRLIYAAPNRSRATDLPALLDDWYAGTISFYLCSTLYRSDLLREAGGFGTPRNLLQDVVAGLRVNALGTWADVEPCKAAFRHHDGEITAAAGVEHWCEDSLHLFEEIRRLGGQDEAGLARGRRFLAEMAYRRCRKAGSLRERLAAERHVAETHGQPDDAYARLARELAGKVGRRLGFGA